MEKRIKIYRNAYYKEFQIRVVDCYNKYNDDETYYTDCKQDAIGTAYQMANKLGILADSKIRSTSL